MSYPSSTFSTAAQSNVGNISRPPKEGFFSGAFALIPSPQGSTSMTSMVSTAVTATSRDTTAIHASNTDVCHNSSCGYLCVQREAFDDVSLSSEALDRITLESRSAMVFGLVDSIHLLAQIALTLQTLEKECGSIVGAFRFFKTAPPGYERGEYASVVLLVVFEDARSAVKAAALDTTQVGSALIRPAPANRQSMSNEAARRMMQSFVPAKRRAQMLDSCGRPRRWTEEDFNPAKRLWAVILWGNSPYIVNWSVARNAARRHEAIIIDESSVLFMGNYNAASLADPSNAQRATAAAVEDDGLDWYGTGIRRMDDGNDDRRRRSMRRSESRTSPWPSALNTLMPPPPHTGDRGTVDMVHRSSLQRYYDERYGPLDYSYDVVHDHAGILNDLRRFRRFGQRCIRWGAKKVRRVYLSVTDPDGARRWEEEQLREPGEDSTYRDDRRRRFSGSIHISSSGAGFLHPASSQTGTASPSRTHQEQPLLRSEGSDSDRRHERSIPQADRDYRHHHHSRRGSGDDAGGDEYTDAHEQRRRGPRLEAVDPAEAADGARMRRGGLHRRFGGVELRRPSRVEAALVSLPGMELIRPLTSIWGFWRRDEGRWRLGDTTLFDPEDRRVTRDGTGSRVVRANALLAAGAGNGDRSGGASSAGSKALNSLLAPVASPNHATAHNYSDQEPRDRGRDTYPLLQGPRQPRSLSDISRLTVDNIRVRLPTGQADAEFGATSSSFAVDLYSNRVPHTPSTDLLEPAASASVMGGQRRKRGGSGSLNPNPDDDHTSSSNNITTSIIDNTGTSDSRLGETLSTAAAGPARALQPSRGANAEADTHHQHIILPPHSSILRSVPASNVTTSSPNIQPSQGRSGIRVLAVSGAMAPSGVDTSVQVSSIPLPSPGQRVATVNGSPDGRRRTVSFVDVE